MYMRHVIMNKPKRFAFRRVGILIVSIGKKGHTDMALSIMVLLIMVFPLLLFAFRSRYGIALFLLTSGMCIAALAVLLQTYNISGYSMPSYFPLRSIDMVLYRYVGSYKQSLAQVQRIRNAGCLIFFLGVFMLMIIIERNLLNRPAPHRFIIPVTVVSVCFPVLFFIFYAPENAYRIYLRYNELGGSGREQFRMTILRMDAVLHGLTLAYILAPGVLLGVQYAKRNTTYFGETAALLMIIIVLYDAIFYFTFFSGLFNVSGEHALKSAFWFFGSIPRIPTAFTLIFSAFSFLISVFIFVNIQRVFSGKTLLLFRKSFLQKRIAELNRNLKDVLHSEKNLMFSIHIMANDVKQAYGTEEGYAKLEQLISMTSKRMETITSSLSRIRQLHIRPKPTDMRHLVDRALEDVPWPPGIQCEKHYCAFPANCVVDLYHTCEAIKNLVINSIEALELLNSKDKKITVTINASKEWVYLTIYDNGIGIDRKAIKQIMMPFVSTKSKTSSWGLGLPYAFRVIDTQLGQMRIQSCNEENRHYTQVDILLPREGRSAA